MFGANMMTLGIIKINSESKLVLETKQNAVDTFCVKTSDEEHRPMIRTKDDVSVKKRLHICIL